SLSLDTGVAPRDGLPRRLARTDGMQAFLDRQPAIEDWIGIVDLAATDARKVAAKQRLQHQHERIAFAPQEFLLEDVGADTHFFEKRNSHSFCLPVCLYCRLRLRLSGKRLSPPPVRGGGGTQYAPRGPGESRLRPRRVFAMC